MKQPLLSIAIPAYGRPAPLRQGLEAFIRQIHGRYDEDIEIIVCDDATPGDTLSFVQGMANEYSFIHYTRYSENIGLEKNLLECTCAARGTYLWIFGDDDFLETDDALDQIIERLRTDAFDMLVLNRTRRSFDLSTLITDNWMRLGPADRAFSGLRDFCLEFGFISVIGFISVNIFKRALFRAVDPEPYFGTMYPQLGAMLEAFHNRPVLLVSQPLVCHRTQTSEEKRAALAHKASEANFMADVRKRNALYFSHPFVKMLDTLINRGAFLASDIRRIPENTVINGLLIDFLLDSVQKSSDYPENFTADDWLKTKRFFERVGLGTEFESLPVALNPQANNNKLATGQTEMLTISVISPSFNQAEFLTECLASVRDQTYQPIEHLVFDPGSKDDSREIARTFEHVTLFEESDEGQSDALNKGFKRAKGDIIAWLNSDDVFASPDVFEKVIQRFNEPDKPDIVYGKGIYINEYGNPLRDVYINKDPSTFSWRFQQEDGILQPALFMRRSVIEKVGPLRDDLHYSMDYEYWIRCEKAGMKFAFVDENLALARYHTNNKTYGQRGSSYAEVCDMMMSQFGYVSHIWLRRYAEFIHAGLDGVLATAQNSAVHEHEKLESIYRELLQDYNGSRFVFENLEANAASKGKGDTLREMGKLGIGPSNPCNVVPPDTNHLPGHSLYTVGPKRWAFDTEWKKQQINKTHAFFRDRIAERSSDVCVIVGNGPSLKKSDLTLLEGHDVIISNNAFLDPRLLDLATYYTVVNYLVGEQSAHHINRLKDVPKVLPYWMSYCLNQGPNSYFVEAVGYPAFSKDIFINMSWRHTVTFFNLHLAFGLGYKRVVMIGFDHAYKQSPDVKEGDIIVSESKDENHFDGRYFQGKKWQAADVGMMEQMYLLAKAAFEEEGREIINSTVGGHLELFPRMELANALEMAPAPESKTRSCVTPQTMTSKRYTREEHAYVDETAVVAHLLSTRRGQSHVMLDVGAHFGTSAAYFDDLGWSIHCFEPDPNNRAKLAQRFGNSKKVRIDPRAVSDTPATGLQFFTSGESTGISGLHAFRDTHTATATVDATTVAEIVRDRNIDRVDFLKIDVEGFDLNVLKGVPWDTLRPDVIECEFEDAKTLRLGHDWKFIASYLEERGYTVYVSEWHPIIRYGIPHDWRRVVPFKGCELAPDAWGNFLAFKEDPGFDAVRSAFAALVKTRASANSGAGAAANSPDSAANVSMSGLEKPATSAQSKKMADDQNGIVNMLQKTPPHALGAQPSPGKMWYSGPAHKLQQISPSAFGALRFARRSFAHVMARPHMIALLLGSSALTAWIGLDARFEKSREAIFMTAGLGILGAALVYVAAKAQAHLASLHLQNAAARAELASVQARLSQVDQQMALSDNAATAALTRQVAQLKADLALAKASNSQSADDLKAKCAELSKQVAELKANLAQAKASNSQSADDFKAKYAELSKQVAEFKANLAQAKASNSQSADDLKAKYAELSSESAMLLADASKIKADLAPLAQKLTELEKTDQTLLAKSREADQALSSRLDAVTKQLDAIKSERSGIEDQVANVSEKVSAIDARVTASEKWSRFENAAWFQHFNRKLSKQHVDTLDKEWRKRLSVPMQPTTLGYMANRACEIERQLEGRLATSIEDILLRSLVARAVRGKNVDVLEIGTLFGTGAAIMFDALEGHYEQIHFTLLDPLEGYYNGAQADILTGQRVNENVVRKNFARVGMREDQYTLIKHLSTEPEAREKASVRKYDVLVIDGDHSYAGVKTDFENYAPLVRVGGYIILDDYNSPDWPDVKEYVDKELGKHDFVAPVGATWRTSVYRVVKDASGLGRSSSSAGGKTALNPVTEDTQRAED